MPLLTITSNITPPEDKDFLKPLSIAIAEMLGKPERYVMLNFQTNPNMLFAGSDEPLACAELKSLNLPESETAHFSKLICLHINKIFSIPTDRIYIEFSNPPRHMWGWDNKIF